MIELKHVSKTFDSGSAGGVDALKDVSLTIEDGDIYGIIGMSGAGKSTLVRCINLLERPTSGEIVVNGQRLDTMTPAQLREARRGITMIFQHFNLLMQRTCLKNVCFPMELVGVKKAEAEERARQLLELVGLPDKADAYPAQLSGGQQQRVAIARALATDPKVLLCDEATSALDPNTTRQILELIRDLNKKLGITVVIITHQMSVVKEICSQVAILDGGVVAEEGMVAYGVRRPQVRRGHGGWCSPAAPTRRCTIPPASGWCVWCSRTARPPVPPWWPVWRQRRASSATSSPPAPRACRRRSTAL